MRVSRRQFLLGSLALGAAGGAYFFGRDYVAEGLFNPCLSGLPRELAEHPLVRAAWEGVRADRVWDCHAHVAGIGADDSGIVIHPDMDRLGSPWRYLQKAAYMNAACAADATESVDPRYMRRLGQLLEEMAPGYKAMLLAFDWFHDAQGRTVPERSTFYVPNDHVRKVASTNAGRFEWLASVHPYRHDAISELERVAKLGARGIKWLPAAQGMDPASRECIPFYDALARLKLPLLVHCGAEQAVHGGDTQHLGNPLRMRLALDHGVKVIVAHCATLGEDIDTDKGGDGPRTDSYWLFARLMDDPQYKGRLFGDISAITQVNRKPGILHDLLSRDEWSDRLLHGSDYPLPGIMPLYSTDMLIRNGLLPSASREPLAAIRRYNPLLYDFVLKRNLRSQGKGFAASVFETKGVFSS